MGHTNSLDRMGLLRVSTNINRSIPVEPTVDSVAAAKARISAMKRSVLKTRRRIDAVGERRAAQIAEANRLAALEQKRLDQEAKERDRPHIEYIDAILPAPKPPEIVYTPEAIRAIEEARKAIVEDSYNHDRYPTMENILKLICEVYGVSRTELFSDRRSRYITRPRQHFFLLCKKHTMRSLPEMARFMGGRDHTTALHGIRLAQERLDKGDELMKPIPDSWVKNLSPAHTAMKLLALS